MSHPPYKLGLRLDSFEVLAPLERGRVLRHLVEALADANAAYLARVRVPLLYDAGIRYADAHDEWRDVPTVLAASGGDCKDLVAWRVAELRLSGRRAVPRILWIVDDAAPNQHLYHVILQHSSGRFEDPSKILGMP